MNLLLDTHAALWFVGADPRLSEGALAHLRDASNRVLISAVVVWEVAVKRSLGKLDAPENYLSLLLGAGAQALAVTIEHAVAVEGLPWHRRDPFDRMLVAQASVEGAAIVSSDEALRAYGVSLVWVTTGRLPGMADPRPSEPRPPSGAGTCAAALGVAARAPRPAPAGPRARDGRPIRPDRDRSRGVGDPGRRRGARRAGADRGDRRHGRDRRADSTRRAVLDAWPISNVEIGADCLVGDLVLFADADPRARRGRDAGAATAAAELPRSGSGTARASARMRPSLPARGSAAGAVVGSYAVVPASPARAAAAPWPSTAGSRPARR